ncbi:helix-turn-helix transcriptional regulator [Asanoa sp. NPDC049573]|uniref:ArsR/SmtB family transcription factor n=1 Tax=Asanoa sp. NPDC049573 TaxID=3155396 RepID=UPI00343D45E0
MTTDVDLTAVARLIAEPARAAMLDALLSGQSLAAGELARAGGVQASTASGHLSQLLDGGLISVTHSGRHRYFRLASSDVAHALEALGAISPPRPIRSLRQARTDEAMTFARTCYDHLAGVVAVALVDAFVSQSLLTAGGDGFTLTADGASALADAGVDVAGPQASRRAFARSCLDFTERRPHLAGALGAAVCEHALGEGWFVRRAPGHRALRITDEGRRQLEKRWNITTP